MLENRTKRKRLSLFESHKASYLADIRLFFKTEIGIKFKVAMRRDSFCSGFYARCAFLAHTWSLEEIKKKIKYFFENQNLYLQNSDKGYNWARPAIK